MLTGVKSPTKRTTHPFPAFLCVDGANRLFFLPFGEVVVPSGYCGRFQRDCNTGRTDRQLRVSALIQKELIGISLSVPFGRIQTTICR